jgi:sarcosine oxidase
LLADYSPHITVLRKTLCWYSIESGDWAKPERAPLFLLDVPGGQFYGLSSVDGHTIKVGMHTGGKTVVDPTVMSRDASDEDQDPLNNFVSSHLVGIESKAARSVVCMYSMSPDGHFLFDKRTDLPLVVGAGFSGHGFKFTSVLGEVAADLIESGQSRLDIDFLSSNRIKR